MWQCPSCNRQFTKNNQLHSCNEKTIHDFFKGKQPAVIALFDHFVETYQKLGDITVHATRTMIAIADKKTVAWVIHAGKDFIDIMFPFKEAFENNLCFVKIKNVPGTNDYNHYFRMYLEEDVNEEVMSFMRKALLLANS